MEANSFADLMWCYPQQCGWGSFSFKFRAAHLIFQVAANALYEGDLTQPLILCPNHNNGELDRSLVPHFLIGEINNTDQSQNNVYKLKYVQCVCSNKVVFWFSFPEYVLLKTEGLC